MFCFALWNISPVTRAGSQNLTLLEQACNPAQTFCQEAHLPAEALPHISENLSPSNLINPRTLFIKPQPALSQTVQPYFMIPYLEATSNLS